MKPATIKTILQEKLKEMQKYLTRFEKDQKDMRREAHLPYAQDILNDLSHQIGYMTGAVEQTKDFLHMLDISDKEFFDHRKAVDEHNKVVMDQLRSIIDKKGKKK